MDEGTLRLDGADVRRGPSRRGETRAGRVGFAALALFVVLALPGPAVRAQTPEPAPRWTIVVDGEPWPWLIVERGAEDDRETAARAALTTLHSAGFFRSRIDSVDFASGRVRVSAARRVVVDAARLHGSTGSAVPTLDMEVERSLFADSLEGRSFDGRRLRRALERLLARLEAAGYPRAEARITGFRVEDSLGLDIDVEMDAGRRPVLQGLLLEGNTRTRPQTIERILKVQGGRELAAFDSLLLRQRLENSGLFARVATPRLLSTGDTTAVMQIVVEEAAPGFFDAALGYQPPAGGKGGGLVGTGRLELLNPLGSGRRFSVLFDRLPGQVSRAEVMAADPAVFGSPFGLEFEFRGLQQDSTFGRQAVGLAGLIELARDLQLATSWTTERVRPGTAGARIVGSRQQVARSDGDYLGVGFRYGRLDDRFNPTSGLRVDARVERGAIRRSTLQTTAGDTTVIATRHRVERLTAAARWFRPAGGRRVLAIGLDASVLASPNVDRGDLVRLGGARSLRGYDEDRFEGKAVGRLFAELRQRLDARSYAYLFADLGFVDAPAVEGIAPGTGTHPGFGLGIQLDTAAGLVLATYGFNPDDGPTRGRVHVSFSFGL